MTKRTLFVESIPLVADSVSGVGHALAGIVGALASHKEFTRAYTIVLVAPGKRLHLLDRWPELKNCQRRGVPLKLRVMNRLSRYHLLPKMDRLLGRGVYLFGSFNNWPLTKASTSFTYVHDVCYIKHPEFIQPANLSMLQKNMPYFMRRTNYVITVSESSREEVIDAFKLDPARVIMLYNGVNTTLFKPYPKAITAPTRKKYGIDRDYALFVGNIEPRKNLERLVRAFATLPKKYALVMVGGDGWKNAGVLTAIEQAKKQGATIVKPKTYVEDQEVAHLMAGAAAFVFPSLHEGFGMPPLEAMASGTPVVVGDIPVLREVVGNAGLYCDPEDEASIAKAITQALQLPSGQKQALITRAKQRANRFNWQTSAERFATILLSLGG